MSFDVLFGSGLLAGFLVAKAGVNRPEVTATMMTSSEGDTDTAALLVRCAQSDPVAFRKLYDQKSPRLYGIALRITRNPALAADAVHDALLQVWRNSARFDADRGNGDAWLLSLVRYRALDIARRSGRETTGVEMPEQADEDPDALTRLVADAEGTQLRACLERVDPPRRNLIVLAFIEGLSQTQVATRMNQPLGTIKSSIRRTLLALRQCLTEQPKQLERERP